MHIENTNQDMLQRQRKSFQTPSNYSSFEGNLYQCRICLQSQIFGNVISPCKCKSFVHPACLQEWLNWKKSLNCEVCLEAYQIKWRKIRTFSCEIFVQAYEKEECEIMKKAISTLFFFVLCFFFVLGLLVDIFKVRNESNQLEIDFVFSCGIGISFFFMVYFIIKIIVDYCISVEYKLQL